MYLNKAILTSFNFTLIDDGILGKTLHSLRTKTSAGHDGISVSFSCLIKTFMFGDQPVSLNGDLSW